MLRIRKVHWVIAAILDAIIISLIVLYFVGCSVTPNPYEYRVYVVNGVGYSHLYTAEDKQDAIGYINFYRRSHGDMQMVRIKK